MEIKWIEGPYILTTDLRVITENYQPKVSLRKILKGTKWKYFLKSTFARECKILFSTASKINVFHKEVRLMWWKRGNLNFSTPHRIYTFEVSYGAKKCFSGSFSTKILLSLCPKRQLGIRKWNAIELRRYIHTTTIKAAPFRYPTDGLILAKAMVDFQRNTC